MENNICPYLGLIDDPRTCATYPDGANACHNIKPPVLLEFDYQRTTCLQPTHRECAGYVDGWKDGVPRAIRRRNPMLSPALREGLAWLLLAIPVLLFIWAGFTGRLGFLSLDFRASPGSTPTSLPFFTRTPTETAIPTETFTPTLTLTETPVPTAEPDTPTPTQTEERTATETSTPQPTATATRFFFTAPPTTPTNTPTQPPRPTQPPAPTDTPPPTNTPPPPPTNTPLPTPET